MHWLKKTSVAILLIIGLPITGMAISELLSNSPTLSQEQKEGSLAALMLFGLPPTGLAGWLIWEDQQNKKRQRDRRALEIEQIFLHLLQEGSGYITPLRLAATAEIPLDEAKQYLDAQAIKLNATFETSEEGGIIYCFSL